jgi:ATP-binding cassette, subfamily B, bacterial PglK
VISIQSVPAFLSWLRISFERYYGVKTQELIKAKLYLLENSMIKFLSKFLYVLQGKHKDLLLMIGLFLFVSFLEAIGTGLVGPFMALATNPDSVNQNPWLHSVYVGLNLSSESQMILLIGGLVILIFYLKAFLSFNAQKYVFEFGFTQQGELSVRLMHAYLSAPYTFHLSRNSAVLIQHITRETNGFVNQLMLPLLNSVSNAIVILGLSLLLVKTNALAMITIAAVLLVAFVTVQSLKDRMVRWGKEGYESNSEMIRLINHGLGGLKDTKIIGCEAYFEEQLNEQAKKFGISASRALSYSNLPRYMIEALLVTFLIVFTFLFINLNRDNSQNLSSVLGVFALASIRLLPATGNLLSSINGIRTSFHALDQLYFDLKELEPPALSNQHQLLDHTSQSIPKTSSTLAFKDKISLENLVYQYPNAEKNALEGISLTIQKGKSIGLIGKSGAGKTTLVDVLLGLLEPQIGDIQVDGVSIYSDVRSWQNMIGYVPQAIFLIDDTLERNIAFGVPDHLIDQGRLSKALEAAQLSELVEQFPKGMQTMVGERGVLLSGGQRQRVGIARALYHEREILVFDEATAALDNETEGLVTEAIKSLSGIKTMIIIAHRLSTIEHCDRIYMLENGRVVKAGSYREVVLNS